MCKRWRLDMQRAFIAFVGILAVSTFSLMAQDAAGPPSAGTQSSSVAVASANSGPALLSGGTAGPEATVFAFLAFAATAFAVYRFTARSVVQ